MKFFCLKKILNFGFKIDHPPSVTSRDQEKLLNVRSIPIEVTIKLGYEDHSYNEFTAITQNFLKYLIPNGYFIRKYAFMVLTMSGL